MNIVNLNSSKQDLIEYVTMASFKDTSGEKKLIGFRQSMFFDIENEVSEKSMVNITKPISISKLDKLLILKDKKLVEVSPNEFKEIIKKIEKVK
jgi:hypothetical protein